MKTFMRLALSLALLFVWSCEENIDNAESLKDTELKLGHFLTSDKLAYTFYVDSFIRENAVVYNEGRLNDLDDNVAIPAIWDSVMVRWGFRVRPSSAQPDPKVYWWQKTKIDVNTQNPYETIVEEEYKTRFTPRDFPEALLNEDETEVFALAEINGFKISQSLRLPDDFKAKVLQASVIEGMIYDAQAAQDKRLVEGAAVFIGHKSTGNIYQGFSNSKGLYRVTVRRTGDFFMAVLRNGFVPYEANLNVVASTPETNVALTKLSTGTSIVAESLYEVKPFRIISGSSSSSINGRAVVVPDATGVPGAFVLFYDRNTDQVTFVQADSAGNFNTNLPAGARAGEDTTVSVTAGAYGYRASSGSKRIDQENPANSILSPVSFTRDLSTGEQTKLAWGPRSTGGPSNFAHLDKSGNEGPVKLKYTSSGVTVRLDLVATGPFVPTNPSVVWKLNTDTVVADQNGLSATITLDAERSYAISAGFKDTRNQVVVLTRRFDINRNYNTDADDPVVVFEKPVVQGGAISDESGGKTTITEDSDPSTPTVVNLGVKAVDPDNGDDDGLTYVWNVNGKDVGTGKATSVSLPSGETTVRLTVTSKDKGNSVTIVKVYAVGTGNGGTSGGTTPTGGGTQGSTALGVSYGQGSSGGVIPLGSTLGQVSKPLRYSTKGAANFKVTLKALVTNSVGALRYSWGVVNAKTSVAISESRVRSAQKEAFTLTYGTYKITVTVTDSAGTIGTASRTFEIVQESGVSLPSGTIGAWTAVSSGGAGDSDPINFKDEGSPVEIRTATDISDAAGNKLLPIEWYVDGELQEGVSGLDVRLNLPSGGGSQTVTRVVLGVGRGKGTNDEPVTVRRVFNLGPSATQSALGPVLRWGSSTLASDDVHGFDGASAVKLSLNVLATSPGSQDFRYVWSINGNVVAGQTSATAALNLNQAGDNTVSVTVSNTQGSASLSRTYKLNTLPKVTVAITKPAQGTSPAIGDMVGVLASAVDPDTGSVLTYSWKFKSPTSSLWETTIPGIATQPSSDNFEFSTSSLETVGTYKLQVQVADSLGSGGLVTAEASFILNANNKGPEISWGTSSLDSQKVHSFDGNRGLPLSLDVQVTEVPGETYTYAWTLNGVAVTGTKSVSLNLNQAGPNVVGVTVTNSKGSAALEKNYVLNTVPTVSVSLSSSTVVTGRSTSVIAIASDGDKGTTLSYVWKFQRPGSTIWEDIPNVTPQPTTNLFELLTRGFSSGSYKVQVAVSDGMGATATAEVALTITANRMPTLGEIQLPSGVTNGGVLQLNSASAVSDVRTFSVTGSDPDGDTLTYTWSINGKAVTSGTNKASASLDIGIPAAINSADPGHRIIQVTAVDQSGGSVNKSVMFRVNHAPSVVISTRGALGSGADRVLQVVASASDVDSGSALTYAWKIRKPGNSNWISLTDKTGNLDLSLAGFIVGDYKLQVTVSDGAGGSAVAESGFSLQTAGTGEASNDGAITSVSVSVGAKSGGQVPISATINNGVGSYSYVWRWKGPSDLSWSSSIPGLNPQPTENSFNLPVGGLDPGTYKLEVTATSSSGGSVSSETSFAVNTDNSISSGTPSFVSINVGAERRGEMLVSSSLQDFPNPTGYEWKLQKPGSTVWENIPEMDPPPGGASFRLPLDNLGAGIYKLRLGVTNAAGSLVLGMADVTITAKAPDAKRLDAPSKPVQGDRTGTTIETTWGGVKNADGYAIYWKKEGETAELRAKVGTDVREYTLKGLIPNTRYIVEVQAISTTRNYLDSLRSAGRTNDFITGRDSLAEPKVTATLQATGKVLLTWEAVPNADAYGIFFLPNLTLTISKTPKEGILAWWADDSNDEDWNLFTKVGKDVTSYTITTTNAVAPETKYYAYVVASPNKNDKYGASYVEIPFFFAKE